LNGTVLLLFCACRGREEEDFKLFFLLSLSFPRLDHSPNTTHTLSYLTTINATHASLPYHCDEEKKEHHALQRPSCCTEAAHATLPYTMTRQDKVILSPSAYK
jgi:hypothetical protein